jgi:phosphatidylinositol glycan class N
MASNLRQIGFIVLAMAVTRSSVISLQAKQGLPRGNQIVGWLTLGTNVTCQPWSCHLHFTVLPLLMPYAHRLQPNNHYLHRLIVIFLTFAPLFVILTISYEGLFYLGFSIMLITWVRLENAIYSFSNPSISPPTAQTNGTPAVPASLSSSPFRSLTLADARISLFFLTLLQSAFFSTGNVASVSSFSLDSVYRLIPIFDPFSQGALLMLKLMIPFALISANLGILNKSLRVPPSALFMLVMAISDFLTLYFFWVVKDEGSWLEIGSTISHFFIASLLCIFVAALEGVSEMFIAGVEVEEFNTAAPGKERESWGNRKRAARFGP